MLKKLLTSLTVLFILIGFPSKPAAGKSLLDEISENSPLEKVASKFRETASSIIEDAGNEGQYLIQQGAMEILIALQNLDSILTDQQNRAWKELDYATQESFRQIDKQLQSLIDGILRYQDFLYLDISSLLDRIPLLKEAKVLRSVRGISQSFKRAGTYRFELVGSAFGPDAKTRVKVGETLVADGDLESSRANELRFSVPVETLNSSFQEGKIALAQVEVTIDVQRKRAFWERLFHPLESHETVEAAVYRFPVRLLPKTAGTYELVERQQVKVASEPALWSQWSRTVEKSKIGRDCCKHCNCAKKVNVCEVIPVGAEVVKVKGVPVVDRWEGGKCDSWCGWYGNPIIEAGKVCQVWGNWRKSHGGSARLRFKYRLLKDSTARVPRLLRLVGQDDDVERLEFGRLYEAEFSPEFASYDLVLTLFNREEVVITPKAVINDDLADATLEKLGGTVYRLLVKLGGA